MCQQVKNPLTCKCQYGTIKIKIVFFTAERLTMGKKKLFPNLVLSGVVATLFLAACNLPASVDPVPLTATPAQPVGQVASTATETAVPTATETPIPTLSATDTATPTEAVASQVIPNVNAYCRKGPNTLYHQVTILTQGNPYYVIGQNGQTSQNIWWQIQWRSGIVCWVSDVNVTRQGAVEQAQVVPVPPLPGMPSKFDNSFVCNPSTNTLSVTLTWTKAAGVTGYNIYRNDTFLAALKANADFFNENAPLGVNLVYDLEPFNDYGVAGRMSSSVKACK
jgi:hypothetical protein